MADASPVARFSNVARFPAAQPQWPHIMRWLEKVKKEGSRYFLEKKQPENLHYLGALASGLPKTPGNKSFFAAFFSKKVVLADLLLSSKPSPDISSI
jgi:hypothetical protein